MLYALPAWTLFVWATRIRLIVGDDWSVSDLILPVVFTALAVFALVDRRRGLPALIAATVAVWAVRLPLVLVHDHPAGFKVVHAVLAAVSLYLAHRAWRALNRRPAVASTR